MNAVLPPYVPLTSFQSFMRDRRRFRSVLQAVKAVKLNDGDHILLAERVPIPKTMI